MRSDFSLNTEEHLAPDRSDLSKKKNYEIIPPEVFQERVSASPPNDILSMRQLSVPSTGLRIQHPFQTVVAHSGILILPLIHFVL